MLLTGIKKGPDLVAWTLYKDAQLLSVSDRNVAMEEEEEEEEEMVVVITVCHTLIVVE